eukprot:CAMPEP_0171913588 /NCGR_PEP_ID=MMETSP0993-20121228/11811_1 /TAXON_ID=483369 /ORGANISM="non described non described, Strain CCMP2098" /LENGTH=70 /DNA_ID=CAMNT_0012547589 /DNA_START=118 /DNA_END=330 /DNA_ORIENTATION=-
MAVDAKRLKESELSERGLEVAKSGRPTAPPHRPFPPTIRVLGEIDKNDPGVGVNATTAGDSTRMRMAEAI